MPSVTNVKSFRRMMSGSRGWCVSTNTGTSNGGSSPHQPLALESFSHGPAPPLNIRRPMIDRAGPLRAAPAWTASSAFVSPPASP